MAAAAAALTSSSSETSDGPVLSLINKRLRALRKKHNRIIQMEQSLANGKTLNSEQQETLRSKTSVLASIDELEKLRQPLQIAVEQEISLAGSKPEPPVQTEPTPEESTTVNADFDKICDLVKLLYFGNVFDVRTLMLARENLLTRSHERSSCLTYDYVTDDDEAGDPLKELDLDLVAMLGGLSISRPVDLTLSHKDAIEKCVEHAKLWIMNSDQAIEPNSNISYASLKKKLNRIMASEYFTTTPEIRAPVEVAAAAGRYASFQVPINGHLESVHVESYSAEYQKEEDESPNSHANEVYDDQAVHVEELNQGGSEVENSSDNPAQKEPAVPTLEVDSQSKDLESEEQQFIPRKSHQNNRGERGGGGNGRRGYQNGRGGRGTGRGGYQNGRNQFYDQPGGYYPRNNSNYRGRGGRGGMYNNHSPGYAGNGNVQMES